MKGVFSGSVDFKEYGSVLLSTESSGSGNFVSIVINGKDFHKASDIPSSSEGIVEFEVRPARKGSSTFHENIDDLLKQDPKIGQGEAPVNYYLLKEDYCDVLDGASEISEKLNNLCVLIEKLSQLAHYHDQKTHTNYLRLVFIKPEEVGVSQPLVIETKVDKEILDFAGSANIEHLVCLCDSSQSQDPHYHGRKGIFGNTITEFVQRRSENEKPFHYLVRNWNDFLTTYDKNFAVYTSGFAFHKAKREVAEAEVEISNKLSSVVSDITGKLLGIPISLAAVAAIPKSGSIVNSALIVLGVMLASFILSETVDNQKRRLKRVIHSKNMILNSIEGRKEVYPKDLRDNIDQIVDDLKKDEDRTDRLLRGFSLVSWLPFVLAMVVHIYFLFA
ncbi:hypothetical protein DDR56_03490 [Halomonas venusta]|uniref:Uncharacterized protein n=2 Tax=Vreelandella venusta TaxID=44935 RepID=A0ABX2B6I8_9GAMM|nr:hypothetical protein [Halomonas venusta]